MWIWHTTAMELITFTANGAHYNATLLHSLYNELVFYGIICWSKWLTSFCENTDTLKLSLVGSTASLKCQKEPAATIPLGQIYAIIELCHDINATCLIQSYQYVKTDYIYILSHNITIGPLSFKNSNSYTELWKYLILKIA